MRRKNVQAALSVVALGTVEEVMCRRTHAAEMEMRMFVMIGLLWWATPRGVVVVKKLCTALVPGKRRVRHIHQLQGGRRSVPVGVEGKSGGAEGASDAARLRTCSGGGSKRCCDCR